MDCKQCAEDMTAYLDGELDSAGSKQVQAHLAACVPCAEELRTLRETAEFVESHNRALELRSGSWNMVRARITADAVAHPSGFWQLYRRWVAVAAAVLLTAMALGYMQYQQQTQRKNLDRYMSEYVHQREVQIKAQPVLAGTGIISPGENPYADNPFVEIKANVADNPFRSEDR
jgi:anti-sigma factor RsiW